MNFDSIENYIIFEFISGSHLYGLNTLESDVDYRGVCIPPLEILLDPYNSFKQKDSGFKEEDRTIYALKQFMRLCADNNPNIIEFLFVPEKSTVTKLSIWDKIVESKHLFLSKNIKYRFTGYAFSQLKRIQNHRKWLINPPTEEPTREMFGLKDGDKIISNAWIRIMKESLNFNLMKEEYLNKYKAEVDYKNAREQWDNYIAWKKGRNPKRKVLEEKWGYDTKHASHLFRLMIEGKELLLTGNLTFPLVEAEEIRAIKNGKYEYDEMLDLAKNMESNFENWYAESILPKVPDRKALTELYLSIIINK